MVKENLIKIRDNHSFNIKKLESWLSANLSNFNDILSVKQFVGGQSNPTFLITSKNGAKVILGKKPPGKLLPSAHAIEREYRVQNSLNNTSIPCPRMLMLCEDPSVIGTPFYLMEFIQGIVYESILDIKEKNTRKHIYMQMVTMLALLHNIDFRSINLESFGKPGNYSQRQISRWEKQWHLSKQRELAEINVIIDWLNKNIPEKSDISIVHGDFRLGNIIYHNSTKSVQAVLDWELSTLGDPLADFGYMLYPYFVPLGERHGIHGINLKKENIPEVEEVISEYCKVRNIKLFDPTFYIVLSMFRSIAILEGVFARYINGNESSPNAKDIGNDVVPLAKATYQLIKEQ